MAEAIGTVASVLTLVGLLKGCVDAFELIRAARNQKKDLEKLDLKLALEQCRLKSWGKSMGLTREAKDYRRSPLAHSEFCDVVQRALELILEMLTDSDRLSSRYGAQQITIEDGIQFTTRSRSVSKLTAAFKRFRIAENVHKQATKAKHKSIWVLHDRKRYEDLVRELRELVDSVENVTKGLVGHEEQQDLVISRINTINDIRTLNMLSEVCETDYPAISDATSTRADVISMASTHRAKVYEWIDETGPRDSQMEVTEEMESWDLREFREKYLALLNVSGIQVSSRIDNHSRPGPVEFNAAIAYVNKIKSRFASRPMIYLGFLMILQNYQREKRPIGEVYQSVTKLFESDLDLTEGFKEFLPDTPALLKYDAKVPKDGSSRTEASTDANVSQDGGNNTEASIGLSALVYMNDLREGVGHKRYNTFSNILRRFQRQDINATGAMRQMMLLLHDRHDLLRKFNIFLPPGYALFGEEGRLQATTPEGHTWDISSLQAESIHNGDDTNSEGTEFTRMNARTYEKPASHCRIKRLSKRLDMNSYVVLKYYKELILFREDVRQEVLIFPSTLSLASQHAVRTLSLRLGLSYSRVAGESEQIVVGRLPPKSTIKQLPDIKSIRRSLMVQNLEDNSWKAIGSKLDVSTNSELQDEDTNSESQGWETVSSEAEDTDP